jgi:hypothetical protein
LLGVLVHRVMHMTDHLFNSRFHHASAKLQELGRAAKQAQAIPDIDATLVHGPCEAFRLIAAAAFRKTDSGALNLICKSESWAAGRTQPEPNISKQLFENLAKGDASPIRIPAHDDDDVPADITAPAVVVPVVFEGELYAIAMYSPHATGADLDKLEIGMLQEFAKQIALAYEKLSKVLIEQELLALRRKGAGS